MKKINTEEKALYIVGWIILLLVALGVGLLKLKPDFVEKNTLPCLLHLFTGLYCPGCGGTRAILSLLEGRVVTSFLYHPLVLYAVIVGGWFMLSHTIEYASKGRATIGMKYRDVYLWIALGLVAVNFVVKNIMLFCGIDALAILS